MGAVFKLKADRVAILIRTVLNIAQSLEMAEAGHCLLFGAVGIFAIGVIKVEE